MTPCFAINCIFAKANVSELVMTLEHFGSHIFGLLILLFLDYHRSRTLSIIIACTFGIKWCVDWLVPEEVVYFGFYSLWVSIFRVVIAIISLYFVL